MKAMILAAGLGTRLKPLTDSIPKALVEVEGIPMLQRVITHLKSQGFDKIVVNVHHLSSMIIDFLSSRDFGVDISISDESDSLLDTGGGIVKAAPLLFSSDDSPVLIHNVDILSNADLMALMDASNQHSTLLVSRRDSSRKLIFRKDMTLSGWHDVNNNIFKPDNAELELPYSLEFAFSGIYSLTKEAVSEMGKIMGNHKFPIMDYFLHPLRKSNIRGLYSENLRMLDIGKPATLAQASEFI